uniref:Uncharacterized protein n=1 Tax=Hyaloperonospora arabidopsidis (strain Emoy2) TaxID=559515 RepID=M4BDL1_HYAAE
MVKTMVIESDNEIDDQNAASDPKDRSHGEETKIQNDDDEGRSENNIVVAEQQQNDFDVQESDSGQDDVRKFDSGQESGFEDDSEKKHHALTRPTKTCVKVLVMYLT